MLNKYYEQEEINYQIRKLKNQLSIFILLVI